MVLPERPAPKKSNFGVMFILLLVLPCAIFWYVRYFHASGRPQATAAAAQAPQAHVTGLSSAEITTLGSNVQAIIAQNPDVEIGVAVVDLKTGNRQSYGVADSFEAASTAKLITAADFLHHVEDGNANLSDTVNGNSAQYELQQMIEVSDDDAWAALNDTLGHADLATYAASIGLVNYNVDANTLPATDIATLLQKLYAQQLLNQANTALLLGYMAQANYAQYIGAVVPQNAQFYHKAGYLEDRVHDAGIIDDGTHAVAIVIFTKNAGDDENASPAQPTAIQQIAAAILKAYHITKIE